MKSKYIDISNIFNGNKPQYLDLKKHPANKDNKIYLSDLDKSDVIGYSLLHHAVENGDEKFVKLLLENGAFVNLVSERQSKKKPIELAANKIKKHQKQEEVIKYKNIQSMLIDYGADSSPITTFQPNTKKIVQVKKKVLNKQIVIECAEENKKLEKIYLDFYNFLQSELFHKISEIKSKINHFKSGKHIDEVNEDFCARITRYYKEDIINPDADIGHKIEQESRNSGDNIQLTLTSLLSGIAKKELLEKYQKEGEKILLPHWEQIADKAIAQFMNYLKNTEVSYNADLGIKAAESFLPNYSKGIMQLDAKLNKFSIDTAKKLGAVVQLAYESKKKIEEVSKDWGFEECYVRQSDLFKSVVMCNEEKIIIAFRGTYHNQNWLSNIHALKTTIKIKEQDITVHTGFHEALMTHWDRENDNEKPLKEIIKKYLNDYPKAKIYITGHSLGGAMASIAYCKLLELGTKIGKPIEIDNVSLYTYGQPLWMTANSEAIVKELFKGNYYRIANYQDLVPTVPPESLGYKHLGELYYLHKDGRMIDQKTFDQIKLQKDAEGYSQITNNPVAKALYIEQHFISNYNKQLNNCKNIVISKETSVSQPINVNEAYIADQIQISDPLCKEALAKLESLLINSKLEDPKQQDMVIKLMEERIETTEISKPLQQQSKSIKPATKKKATNIFEAAAYGDLEKFQSFLVKGSNINKVDEFGSTVLHYAARGGHERLAEILLNKKPELIDMVDEFGNTVLHSAAMGGNEKLAEILLNKKPELIDMVTNIGSTVLYYAASGGNEKLAEMLLKARVKCKLDDLHSLNSTSQKKEGIAECYYLCGLRKSKEGANLEATKAYTKALELNPYKYNLASSFISNQLKLNKDFVQQQLAMQANSKSLYQLAVLYLLQNEYEKGLNIFNSTEVDARVKPAFSLGAALALVKLGKYTEAEQLLTNYKTTAETLSTDYWYITAELMVGLKQYKETFTCYSKLTDYGYHMGAIAGIGNLYFKTNQLGQAKECYLKILADKNVDFNLTERAEQQITFIETAEFINKQIAIEQTVQNLTMEFDKSLAETIAFDLIYAKKWLQQNLPKSLSNYHKILNEIDYGYKLLNSEGILPKTFGFMSDFLPKEKQLISFAWADKELRTEHDYFKIINNIYKQLESLKEVISKNGTLKDDIKEEALVKINQVQDYYKYYIEQVIIEYGANYRQTTYDDKKYVTILSKIAEEKKPLLSKEILGNKTKVQFEDGKHGFLEPILSQKLTTNKPQAGNKYGKHLVVEVNSVHYKYSPYAPGIEFAVNSLHNLILDGITPPSKLLKISTESGQEKAIYLASKTIKGENLQKILFLPTEYMQKLDMENYSGTIIACLLTSPGDAKPDNFMVTFGVNKDSGKKSFKIVGIDNDISFCKGKLGVNKIAGKQKIYSDILNVLYFFPQMDELVSPKLKEYLTSSNITGERIISSWLKALYTQNTRYTDNGFTKDDLDEMKLPIKFKAGTVVEVYRKLDGIINLLKANEYITHNALFKKFYPGVSYFYEKIRQQSKGEFEAIKQLYMAAAESEELAQQLVSREVQERDAAWNKISTSRMMNQETFKQVYDHTIEKETEDFIAAIDFGKFGREDYAVFRMLQDNLNFVQELKLYNVTEEQLNALLFTVIDGQNVSKFERLKTIKLSNSNVSNENLEKIIKYYTDQRMKITTSLNNDEVKSDISPVLLENISKNIDINQQDKDGNTELHRAVIKRDIEWVKSLLDCGIDETIRNKQGKKAIDLAEEKQERIEIYQLIAEHEPQIFWSVLGAANGKIAAQLAKTMSIEKLTMPVRGDIVRSNCEALEVALVNDALADTALQLIKRLDINKSYGRDNDSSLHLLARNYNDTHVNIMEAMISKFPDLVTKRNNLGQTAADIAQDTKKYNFLSLLINKNCVLSKFTDDNEEIVYKAAKYGIKVEKSDSKDGYNHSKYDKYKNNLLKLAVKNKDYTLYEKIKAVPQYSKELENLYDHEDNHKLACNDQVNELIKIFKEYGFVVSEKEAITGAINLNQTNKQGNSVLYELLKTICINDNEVEKREEKVELLINAGLNVNTTNRADKWTPMHLVASSKQQYYVEKLMSKGGKLLEDVYNRTPIEIAKRCGYIDIENSLISLMNENNAYSIEQPHHLPPYEHETGLLGAGTVSLL